MKINYSPLITLLFLTLLLNSCGILLKEKSSNRSFSSFTNEEIELIINSKTNLPLRVLKTTDLRDSLFLRRVSDSISFERDSQLLKRLVLQMLTTVNDSLSQGVGIAAPQVGISKRVILVQRFDKQGEPFEAYLNPKITKFSNKKQECPEGCLSVPGVRDKTQNRAYAICIEYLTMEGEHRVELVEGYTAVIFQHEIDHLDGILFFDHL